jgi:hypothetical protein
MRKFITLSGALSMTNKEILIEAGFEDVEFFENYDYDGALIGVTTSNCAVYSFSKMVEWLMETEGFTYTDAVEWIEYNTIRSLPYFGPQAPVIMYDLEDYK